MESIQTAFNSKDSKDSGVYGYINSGYMEKRESQLSDLSEYLDQNSAKKIISDPMNQSQLSEAIYEQIPNAAYVSENQLAGTGFNAAPILKMEIPSVEKESRKSKDPSNDDGRQSRSSLASDSVFPRTGMNQTV